VTKKDRSIRSLVASLRLEEHSWVIVDPWEADLFAVGIGRADQPRRRVYVSTWKQPKGRYYYECETPTGSDPTDYEGNRPVHPIAG
jgi:hypothetical protein